MSAYILYESVASELNRVDRYETSPAMVPEQPVENMFDRVTWNQGVFQFEPGGKYTVRVIFTSDQTIDALALASHNLSGAINIQLWGDQGAGIDLLEEIPVPINDAPYLVNLSQSYNVTGIELIITMATAPAIGVFALGKVLPLPMGITAPLITPIHGRDTTIYPNVAERGELLGTSVIRYGWEFQISQDNVAPQWVDDNWLPFVRSIEQYPFFYAWDYEGRPTETVYAWINQSPGKPSYKNPVLMQFSLDCRGLYVP